MKNRPPAALVALLRQDVTLPVEPEQLSAVLTATGMTRQEFGLRMARIHPALGRKDITLRFYENERLSTNGEPSTGIRLAAADYVAEVFGLKHVPPSYLAAIKAWRELAETADLATL